LEFQSAAEAVVSLDHLVGGREQVRRHTNAERLRRFEIDQHSNFGSTGSSAG
jgi:hypothetical protein